MDKPTCPYCGGQMHVVIEECRTPYQPYTGMYNGHLMCACGSQSPMVRGMHAKDVEAAALSAAMQRYVEPANGCCWCIADGVINKVYIRTDDSDYTFVDAKFCPKCGRDLEESQ